MVTERAASQRHYPVPCPACTGMSGYPITVQTVRSVPGRIRIDICCHKCKEQWVEEVDIEGR